MIEASHAVLLHGRRIGSILQRGDVARFVFADGYWEDPSRDVLGLWFEDDPRRSPKAASRLPPWFSNLLPEGQLRQLIAHSEGVSADRELQLLLPVGRDLAGAVQVLRGSADDSFDPELLAESQVFPARENNSGGGQWKFSLAGVGLKYSLLKQNDRLVMPGSDEFGNWIVKLPDPRFRQAPENEFATMNLAKAIGIEVPEIRLVHRDELPRFSDLAWPGSEELAYAISRFDRSPDGARVHIEDLAQVRGFYDNEKYDGSFETVANLIYRGYDTDALCEFVRRLTFNLLIGNGDAHLKNWSLIYKNRRIPTLSPAYDLMSTAPYAGGAWSEDFGMKFGKTKSPERICRSTFASLERRLNVNSESVLSVMDETIERFGAAWDDAAETFPRFVADWISSNLPEVINRLVEIR